MKRTQINKIRDETGEFTMDTTEIQWVIRLLHATICQQNGQLRKKNGQILKMYNLPSVNQEEIENMNRTITSSWKLKL